MERLISSGSVKQAEAPAVTVEAQNADMRSRALRAALYALGIGGVIGGGSRLVKELTDPVLQTEPELHDRDILIDITNPAGRSKRTKRAGEEPITSPMELPYTLPLIAGGVGLGLYGGNALVRHIVEGIKKRRAEASLESAQREFEDALRSQYRNKAAQVEEAIEAGYAKFEKSAEAGWMDYGKGLGLTAMAAIWLLAHKSFYDAAKKSDPEALQMKILERQRRLRQTMAPPPIVFDIAPGEEGELKDMSKASAVDEDVEEADDAADETEAQSTEGIETQRKK